MEKKQRKRNSEKMMMGLERDEGEEVVGSATWLSQFDERDFEASQILLDLQSGSMAAPATATAVEMERRGGGEKKRIPFTVVWGRRKLLASKSRRAAGGFSSCTTLMSSETTAAPPPSQRVKPAVPATSPDTPLMNINQHSSESEDSPQPSQPPKKKKKELMQNLEELNDCREKLKKEVENVTAYYKELLASNQMWKQTKQMVEKSYTEMKNKNCSKFGVRSGQLYLESQHHQGQFLLNPNPTARIEPPQEKFELHYHHHQQGPQLYGQGPSVMPMGRLSSRIGPRQIVKNQAMEQIERARIRAEEARKRRKMLILEKQQRLQKPRNC